MSKQGYEAFGVDRDAAAVASPVHGLDRSFTIDHVVRFLSRKKRRYHVVSWLSILHLTSFPLNARSRFEASEVLNEQLLETLQSGALHKLPFDLVYLLKFVDRNCQSKNLKHQP